MELILPIDIQNQILNYLNEKDLAGYRTTCKLSKETTDRYCQKMFEKRFGPVKTIQTSMEKFVCIDEISAISLKDHTWFKIYLYKVIINIKQMLIKLVHNLETKDGKERLEVVDNLYKYIKTQKLYFLTSSLRPSFEIIRIKLIEFLKYDPFWEKAEHHYLDLFPESYNENFGFNLNIFDD